MRIEVPSILVWLVNCIASLITDGAGTEVRRNSQRKKAVFVGEIYIYKLKTNIVRRYSSVEERMLNSLYHYMVFKWYA
jgi:hypothetical protein